jgi:hypothetical protein
MRRATSYHSGSEMGEGHPARRAAHANVHKGWVSVGGPDPSCCLA